MEEELQNDIQYKTATVQFVNTYCVDCGIRGVSHAHWGCLIPKEEEMGRFCSYCWHDRLGAGKKGEKPKPLGYKMKKSATKKKKVRKKEGV